MKVNEKLDPVKYGFAEPEVKLSDIDPLLFNRDPSPEVLEELKVKITDIRNKMKLAQIKLPEASEGDYYACKQCGMRNWGKWLKDPLDGSTFRFCGNCNTILEVK
jgi:hypothetical protein